MITDTHRQTPTAAHPRGESVQLLSETGVRKPDERYAPRVSHLDRQDLESFYRDMVVVRRFDHEATALQRHGELGLWPPCFGQEGAQVGSAHAIARRDFIFPSYREHGVAHVRGVPLEDLLPLFRGVAPGGCDAVAYGFMMASLVIGFHAL